MPVREITEDTLVEVSLVDGWNFIASPYKNVDFELDTSSPCVISAIYHYDPSAKKYLAITGENVDLTKYEKGTEEYEEAYKRSHPLSGVRPGSDYWVYSNACTFYWKADTAVTNPIAHSDLGDNFDGTLRRGWNQVGGTSTATNLWQYRGDCDLKVIYGFDSDTEYKLNDGTMARGKYFNPDFVVEPGQAYWVFVGGTQDTCTLAPASAEVS